MVGAFAALALAGCGRKGPLDPPPAAAVTGDQAAPTAPMAVPFGSRADAANPALGPDGKPLVPKGPNKHIFLDDILN